MSGNGGSLPGGLQIPSTFTISAPFVILPFTTVSGPPSSLITVSTVTTSTFSTTAYQTFVTTASTIVTQTLPLTVIPTASLAAERAATRSNTALTRTNTIVVGVLCGFIILLMLALGLFAVAWIRRRRRGLERQHDSSPFPSLAVEGSQQPRSQQARTQVTASPTDLRGALSSHPPKSNRLSFSRPFSPAGFNGEASHLHRSHQSPQDIPLPIINVQPNTPSVLSHDDNTPISPILQASPARMPFYHEPLAEEAGGESSALGLPVQQEAQRASVSSAGSDYGEGATGDLSPERVSGVLHSTRASSGVFPESS